MKYFPRALAVGLALLSARAVLAGQPAPALQINNGQYNGGFNVGPEKPALVLVFPPYGAPNYEMREIIAIARRACVAGANQTDMSLSAFGLPCFCRKCGRQVQGRHSFSNHLLFGVDEKQRIATPKEAQAPAEAGSGATAKPQEAGRGLRDAHNLTGPEARMAGR